MAKGSLTVSSLAAKAKVDTEQALVALWGEGVEYVDAPNSVVERRDMRAADRALGLLGGSAEESFLLAQRVRAGAQRISGPVGGAGFHIEVRQHHHAKEFHQATELIRVRLRGLVHLIEKSAARWST